MPKGIKKVTKVLNYFYAGREKDINKSSKPSRFIINLIKNIMSISMPRKTKLMLLKPFYERKLMPLYNGRPYMRLLVQKI